MAKQPKTIKVRLCYHPDHPVVEFFSIPFDITRQAQTVNKWGGDWKYQASKINAGKRGKRLRELLVDDAEVLSFFLQRRAVLIEAVPDVADEDPTERVVGIFDRVLEELISVAWAAGIQRDQLHVELEDLLVTDPSRWIPRGSVMHQQQAR